MYVCMYITNSCLLVLIDKLKTKLLIMITFSVWLPSIKKVCLIDLQVAIMPGYSIEQRAQPKIAVELAQIT